MRFSSNSIAILAAVVAAPIVTKAFTAPSTSFVSRNVKFSADHFQNCPCYGCTSTGTLQMSSEEVVPEEVAALDGVASEEEAHNTDRPARDSGIKKHKGKKNAGTPISELEIGSMVDGTVKTITSYGAFVDIGASTDALLHVSRLSADFVSSVEDVVKAGDKVSVRIASVDAEKGQVALSMLSEEEESNAKDARSSGGRRKQRPQRSNNDRSAQVVTLNSLNEAGYDDSKFVEGEVVSTLDFGAFVRFDAGQFAEGVEGELDGLVHISALSTGRADSVQAFVSVGDKVQVRIRQLDLEASRVSLSMITKEEEAESRPKRRQNNNNGPQMFTEDEMGAKDWKESLEKMESPDFSNMPVIVDRRKVSA